MTQQNDQDRRFSELWQQHHDPIFAFLVSRLKNRTDAEDLLNKLAEKFYLALSSQSPPANSKAWLFASARNAIVDHGRNADHRRSMKSSHDDIDRLTTPMTSDEAPIDGLLPCLEPFMRRLPEKYRDTLYRSAILGEKQAYIAKELGLGSSAIKSRISRARAMLQQQFDDCCQVSRDRFGAVTDITSKSDCPADCR